MSAPEAETPPPLVVGQEGWFVPRDYRKGGLKSEGRPAKVLEAGRLWATIEPSGVRRLHVFLQTGAAYANRSGDAEGQWMAAEAYALWLAKAAADSERGELVEALRIRGVIVNSSVKTDVLPRLLAALGE